jgi:hypothetical protein
MKRILAAVAFAALVSLTVAPARAVTLILPRNSQVGVGIQGQFGGMPESGELGNEFGTGPGLAVRLKYRMRFDRAMGLSFETRTLDGRGKFLLSSAFPAGIDSLPNKSLTLQTFGFDVYQFFNTRSRNQQYLSASAGLAKINAVGSDGDPVYPVAGDGMFLGVGAGFERFVYRSWAVDGSVRYSAIFLDGSTNHDVQAALGMIFYAAY